MNHIIMSNWRCLGAPKLEGMHVRSISRRGLRLTLASLLCVALVTAACGGDDGDEGASTTASSETAAASEGGGGSDAEAALDELVAAAQDEGSVTVYSSQGL